MIACIFIDYFRIDAQEAAKGGYLWGAEPSDWDTEREGSFHRHGSMLHGKQNKTKQKNCLWDTVLHQNQHCLQMFSDTILKYYITAI